MYIERKEGRKERRFTRLIMKQMVEEGKIFVS